MSYSTGNIVLTLLGVSAVTVLVASTCTDDSKPDHTTLPQAAAPAPPDIIEEVIDDTEEPPRNPANSGTAHHGGTTVFWHTLLMPHPANCSPAYWSTGYRAPVNTPVPAAAARSVPGRAFMPTPVVVSRTGPTVATPTQVMRSPVVARAPVSSPAPVSARGGFGSTGSSSSGG